MRWRCLRPRRHTGVRWRSRSTLRVADTAFTGEKEVLLVHELVHLGTYLLDGGLQLLAVDVDGYPAGAALCHKR